MGEVISEVDIVIGTVTRSLVMAFGTLTFLLCLGKG